MVSWLSNKKKIVKYIITSSNQTQKKTTIIFVKIRNRETGKRLRELEVIVSVKAREVKKKEREKEKYYLHQELELLTLGYTGWVQLTGFQKC